MVKIAMLAVALLVTGMAVVAATPSSYDVEAAYHQASAASGLRTTTLAAN